MLNSECCYLKNKQKNIFIVSCFYFCIFCCLAALIFVFDFCLFLCVCGLGARCSSEVERSLMVRWVVGSIIHGVDPLNYFSFQPVLHDWCNKDRGMCYLVCGMMHIKEPLLLIERSSPCGGSGFPLSLPEWSFTICLTPYNRK